MAQITVPKAPTVEIKTFSDHIKLLWSMDEQNQYGIEMYVIDVIKHNGETEKRFECNVKDGAHYCQLAGLSSASNYQLMVQACNKAGCGASSIFSVATTASSGVFPTVIIVLFVLLLLFTCCIANYDIIKEFIRPLTKRLTNNHFHQSNSMEERRERESLQEVLDILENSMETTRPSNSVYHTTPSTSLALDEFPRSGEQDSREPPPSGTSAPAAAKCGRPLSYDTIVLQAEVHRENQMASFLQYDEKQMASSPQYEKQMASSPQYEKQMASSPQYEKQMASSPQYEKQMASSPQYEKTNGFFSPV
ncbi:uncharacterized protein LOC121868351 [Homarus americanus]|uniref:Putative Fibronectin type III domain-containing protein-like 3 n=1 Tax=Homarus americanus TaxID=6706 RepID=A0A8J5K0S6_HOMAM|nr:uncharacterized protein LOC121868351 [Homarus americanus]KAG7167502.1 putative Fibronectin type III domain-containing protein-like 3 [Homarus americanus]